MLNTTTSSVEERLSVGDIELEVLRRGAGGPSCSCGMQNVDPRAPFLICSAGGRRSLPLAPRLWPLGAPGGF
jgi:hypothetical protein